MTIVHTVNSTYEVDAANRRVRRVLGVNAPTACQGEDGQWQDYESLLVWGDVLAFKWPNTTKATVTSSVVSVVGGSLTDLVEQ